MTLPPSVKLLATPDGALFVRVRWVAGVAEAALSATIGVYDATSLALLREVTVAGAAFRTVSLSRDGARLLTAGGASFEDGGGEFHTWYRCVDCGVRTFRLAGLGEEPRIETDGPVHAAVDLGPRTAVADPWMIRVFEGGRLLPATALSRASEIQAAFGPDEPPRWLATVDGREVWVWEIGRDVRRTRRLGAHVRGQVVAVSVDGRLVASGSAADAPNGPLPSIRVFRVDDGVLLRELAPIPEVRALVFHPDGRHLVAAAGVAYVTRAIPNDRVLQVWDLETGACVRSLDCGGHIVALAISPDGARLAAGHGTCVTLYRLPDGARLWSKERHGDRVMAVAFRPDGAVASAGLDGWVQVHAASDGSPLDAHRVGARALGLAFDAEGGLVVASSGPVELPDTFTRTGHAALSREGSRTAICGPMSVTTREGRALDVVAGHIGEIDLLAADEARGRFVSGGGTAPGSVVVWRAADLQPVMQRSVAGKVSGVAISPTGDVVAAAFGPLGSVRLWRVDGVVELPPPPDHGAPVNDLCFSPRGALLIAGGGAVRVWDPQRGALLDAFAARAAAPRADGTLIVESDERGIHLRPG